MPTDEQRAFWNAIRANPDDDTPRLVYADWLQEQGDEPRAEFIRVQCALAVLGADRRKGRKQRLPLETRERELLARHAHEWLAPVRERLKGTNPWDRTDAWLRHVTLRRGFVSVLDVGLESAAAIARAGNQIEPLDRLTVMECAARYDRESVRALCEWAGAGSCVWLSIAGANDEDVRDITRAEHLRNLDHIGLWYGTVSDDGLVALANWPHARSLRSADLKRNRFGDRGALALVASPYWPDWQTMRRLDLQENSIHGETKALLWEKFRAALGVSD